MSARKDPRVPPGLGPDGKRCWRDVVRAYDLVEHQLELLRLACLALDRAHDAARLISKHGALVEDRFGQLRTNPAIAVERDSRVAFGRILRELDLEVDDDPSADGRSPR